MIMYVIKGSISRYFFFQLFKFSEFEMEIFKDNFHIYLDGEKTHAYNKTISCVVYLTTGLSSPSHEVHRKHKKLSI